MFAQSLGQIELQKALQAHVHVKEFLSVRIGRNPVGIGLLISDILGNEEIVHVGRSLATINGSRFLDRHRVVPQSRFSYC